jgi:AcrR family transcriptional regulator
MRADAVSVEPEGQGGMVRQPRSEATRRTIINAAVDLFDAVGYPSTGLGDIIERVEVTKGALYHHFQSKESLALAIVDEFVDSLEHAFRRSGESSPALESMIRGAFVAAELAATDKLARTGAHLLHTFASFNEKAADYLRDWQAGIAAQARQAQADGDLREDLDPDALGEFIVSTLVGAELISASASGDADLIGRVKRAWVIVLPAIVSERSLPYFREYLERQSQRYLKPTSPSE